MDSRLRGNDGSGCFVLLSPSAPVSSTGTGFDSSPIKGEGIQLVGLDLFTRVMRRPVDSRLRGNDGPGLVVLSYFTLTFDSSPIKGEGDSVGWCCLVVAPPCGFPPTRE